VHRPASQANDPAPMIEALKTFVAPPGGGFIWIAAEAHVTRALRQHALGEMNHPSEWTKASGYWLKGSADTAENFSQLKPPAPGCLQPATRVSPSGQKTRMQVFFLCSTPRSYAT